MVTGLLPLVTVIMPIRNETDYIEKSLGAVLSQDYPHAQLEIIIADGCSQDNTRTLIKQIARGHKIPITIVNNAQQTVPHGLNQALKRARGEILIRVDGHCEIAPDYVTRCVHHLQQRDVEAVGGSITTAATS